MTRPPPEGPCERRHVTRSGLGKSNKGSFASHKKLCATAALPLIKPEPGVKKGHTLRNAVSANTMRISTAKKEKSEEKPAMARSYL